jgi:carboxymethylenebutenolidase
VVTALDDRGDGRAASGLWPVPTVSQPGGTVAGVSGGAKRRHAGTAYIVAPHEVPAPGVLVLHSWWGLTGFFRGVCDRLADAGFVAMAPDLHAGRTADRPDEAEALLAEVDPNTVASLVRSSAETLRNLKITHDRPIGVLGFSMGGSWALWLSARAPATVGAVVSFYGSQDVDFVDSTAAYLGHFADHDEFVSDDEVVEMEAHLRLLDRPVDFHRYPGTGHWFFEQDRIPAFDATAAELAWSRSLAFLHEQLDP